jgi:putative two-component system response regulator
MSAVPTKNLPVPSNMVKLLPMLEHPDNRAALENHDLSYLAAKFMIVDDEPVNVKVVRKFLQSSGYVNFVTTTDSSTAMDLLKSEKPDIVLLDVMMPQVNGLQILEWIRADVQFKHVPVLILTASTDSTTKLAALELGATDFLPKPIDPHELLPRVHNALVVKAHQDYLSDYSVKLEREVRRRTAELETSRLRVFQCLARAGEYRDDATGRHVYRVGRCAALIASELGYGSEQCGMVELAAQLHDIGKIGVPDAILLKPGKLSTEEFMEMKRHCGYGKAIIDPTTENEAEIARQYADWGNTTNPSSESPLLTMAATIALTHHERLDGSGYPHGLRGDAIPVVGRITAIADIFDALRSVRSYKAAYPVDQCMEIIKNGRGTHFDSEVHDAFVRRLPEILKIHHAFAD